MNRMAACALTACLMAAGCGSPVTGVHASAELSVPADSEFVAFTCNGEPATDPVGDAGGGNAERDLVGDTTDPAAFRALDPSMLYLRGRLNGDPVQAVDALKPFGWGCVFEYDGDPTKYELMLLVNGIGSDDFDLWENTTAGTPGAVDDPAENVLVSYTPTADFWHAKTATSSIGGDPDYLLTIGVPIADLEAEGLDMSQPVGIVCGTSNNAQAINVDYLCNDDAGAPPTLDDPPIAEPLDPPAGGTPTPTPGPTDTPTPPGADPEYAIAGSGGCALTAPRPTGAAWLAVLLALATAGTVRQRRRETTRRPGAAGPSST